MSGAALRSQRDLKSVRSSAMSGLRARLATFDLMDWGVILLLIIGLVIAIYTTSLGTRSQGRLSRAILLGVSRRYAPPSPFSIHSPASAGPLRSPQASPRRASSLIFPSSRKVSFLGSGGLQSGLQKRDVPDVAPNELHKDPMVRFGIAAHA